MKNKIQYSIFNIQNSILARVLYWTLLGLAIGVFFSCLMIIPGCGGAVDAKDSAGYSWVIQTEVLPDAQVHTWEICGGTVNPDILRCTFPSTVYLIFGTGTDETADCYRKYGTYSNLSKTGPSGPDAPDFFQCRPYEGF